MKTVKLTFFIAALFAFISCGNSPASQEEQSAQQNSPEQKEQAESTPKAQPVPAEQPVIDGGGNQENPTGEGEKSDDKGSAKPVHLDKQMFLNKVFNYEANPKKWVFEGNRPCIIDFYADWCGPCKRVAPIMDELAKKYKGKIDIYKIDTDEQKELASVFGIRSIPSIMYCPAEGKPYMYKGAFPKSKYLELINKHFEVQ
jgi:thioredoxin